MIKVFRASVRGGRGDVLAHDDDRQQDELEKRLRDPGNDAFTARLQRSGQANQCDRREDIGAPHRAHPVGDLDCQPRIDPDIRLRSQHIRGLDRLIPVLEPLDRMGMRDMGIDAH